MRLANAPNTAKPFPAFMSLLKDMVAEAKLKDFKFDELNKAKTPPEQGGVNIEGLCATRDDKLLIAFRSPVTNGKALLVPLENRDEIIEGKSAQAKIGAPIQLDLGGLGIRDMVYMREGDFYLILAGSSGSEGVFRLYRWTGDAGQAPQPIKDGANTDIAFSGLNPEAMVTLPNSKRVLFLSDDGDLQMRSTEAGALIKNKELPDKERLFRSIFFTMP